MLRRQDLEHQFLLTDRIDDLQLTLFVTLPLIRFNSRKNRLKESIFWSFIPFWRHHRSHLSEKKLDKRRYFIFQQKCILTPKIFKNRETNINFFAIARCRNDTNQTDVMDNISNLKLNHLKSITSCDDSLRFSLIETLKISQKKMKLTQSRQCSIAFQL